MRSPGVMAYPLGPGGESPQPSREPYGAHRGGQGVRAPAPGAQPRSSPEHVAAAALGMPEFPVGLRRACRPGRLSRSPGP